MKIEEKIRSLCDERKIVKNITIFWDNQELSNRHELLVKYLNDNLKNIEISNLNISQFSEEKLSEFNIVVSKSKINGGPNFSKTILGSEKLVIVFLSDIDKSEMQSGAFGNELIFYPLSQIVPILFCYLAIFAEYYLARTTLIEKGDLSGFSIYCLTCEHFKGEHCETCKNDVDRILYKQITPYLPAKNCKIFIEGFKITKPALRRISEGLNEDNKKAYEAIHDLFFSTYKHIPESIIKYEKASNRNIRLYIDILCKIIDNHAPEEKSSLITTDATFLASDECTWFNDTDFIKILAHTKRGLNNNDNLTVSRVLIVDFSKHEINQISERIIPFFILNHLLDIDVYVYNKMSLLKDIQECDLNFFIKSQVVKKDHRLRIGLSESLGIIDTKFPFIRILERQTGPLHLGYISYIEDILNSRILLKEPLNNFHDFKNLKSNNCSKTINETLDNWEHPQKFPDKFAKELLDLNRDKINDISHILTSNYNE